MNNFYDRVAKQFGGYGFSSNDPKFISKYPDDNPEAIFKEKLLVLAKPNLVVLDVGCGDGKFAFNIADKFKNVIGLDSSKELIKIAEQKKKELVVDNISFVFGDAGKMPFKDKYFDIIFNRRGPDFYEEYARLLKPGGYYLEIGIGEKDTMDLKKVFGRGQNYGGWDKLRLNADKLEFESLGLKPIFLKDFMYKEYYASEQELEIFLEGVPIFEDFNLENDRKYLGAYFQNHKDGDQVVLDRHRVVYVVQKQA